MYRWLLSCIAIFCLASAVASGRRLPPIYQDSEGYLLLSLVLNNEAEVQGLREIEIYERSGNYLPLAGCRQIPEEFRAATEDLTAQSRTEFRFAKKFALTRPWILHRLNGATDFEISVVGFDHSRTRAVVAVFKGCGSMCSGGSTYLFRKSDGKWEKAGEVCEVMS